MSTLEKAFLKAMRQEDEAAAKPELSHSSIERTQDRTHLDRLEVKAEAPKAKEAQDIVSSRQGISQMEQVNRYSPLELVEKRFVHTGMKDKILLDRYRNIRTKLLSDAKKSNFLTIITSVVPYENSGMVAANLAATFALDEAKTSMLLEADISNPTLNELFDMPDREGLIDFLESEEWDSCEVLQKTGIPRLRFVPSGLHRENSAEYFTSTKMNEFVKELVERYPDRYPIINAPCVINSADTRILIELCEKVVLVVPYGMCSDEEVMQAALAIGEKKLAGVILDGF